jgi:hypothetical protein
MQSEVDSIVGLRPSGRTCLHELNQPATPLVLHRFHLAVHLGAITLRSRVILREIVHIQEYKGWKLVTRSMIPKSKIVEEPKLTEDLNDGDFLMGT